MPVIQRALIQGLREAARHWRLALPLYLCGLVLGLVQTWPLLAGTADGALYNPYLGELASGSVDALANLLLANPVAAGGLAFWTLLLVPLTGLFGLLYNYFSGGILSVYAGTRPFRDGCRRMFWTFTGLGALLVVLLVPVTLLAFVAAQLFGTNGGLIVAVLLAQVLNLLGEYGRVIAVVRDHRNPLALLGLALRFCVRNPAGALGLALIGLLLHGALAALYRLGAGVIGPTVAIVIWQQIAVLGWIWLKLLRLAWALNYVRALEPPGVGMEAAQVPALV